MVSSRRAIQARAPSRGGHRDWAVQAAALASCLLTLAWTAVHGAAAQPNGSTVRLVNFGAAARPECVGVCTQLCPCSLLQDALDAAQDGDTVWLVPPVGGGAVACEGARTNSSVTVAAAPWAEQRVVLDCEARARAIWFDARARGELVRATVANVTVRNGVGGAGGCVRADDALLEVLGCRLEGCRSTSTDWEATLDAEPGAGGGGVAALFEKPVEGVLAVDLRDTTFTDCSASDSESEDGGGAVLVSFLSTQDAEVHMTRCSFVGAQAAYSGGAASVWFRDAAHGSKVAVLGCTFFNTSAQGNGGAVAVHFASQADSVSTSFTHCAFASTIAQGFGGAITTQHYDDAVAPSMSIAHSTFFNTRAHEDGHGGAVGVLFVSDAPGATTSITNSTFTDTSAQELGGAVAVLFGRDAPGGSVSITHCRFSNTSTAAYGGAVAVVHSGRSDAASTVIAHSTFVGTSSAVFGGAVFSAYAGIADFGTFTIANAAMHNVNAGLVGGAVYLAAEQGQFHAELTDCSFTHCTAGDKGGAVFAALARQQALLTPQLCDTLAQRRAWASSSSLVVRRSTFERVGCRNATCTGGAIDMAGGVLRVEHANATHCTATQSGGFLHTSSFTSVLIDGTRVDGAEAGQGSFVHHEGLGTLGVTGAWFSAGSSPSSASLVLAATAASEPTLFSGESQLLCRPGETFDVSPGEALSIEPWRVRPCGAFVPPASGQGLVQVQSFNALWMCSRCAPGTYFLGAGHMQDGNVSRGNCIACPFGATCHGGADVRANPGMWATALLGINGSSSGSSSLSSSTTTTTTTTAATSSGSAQWLRLPASLVRCADGYCCESNCTSFNSCAVGRTGLLCGECEPGTVGTLGSTACRAVGKCGRAAQDVLFWPATLLLLLAFSAWQVRSAGKLQHASVTAAAEATHTSAAATKATFAFFQTVPLLVLSHEAAPSAASAMITAAAELFNFQAQSGGAAGVCVLGGLSPISAEAVRVTMAALVVAGGLPTVWTVHMAAGWFGPTWCRLHPPQLQTYAAAMTALVMLTYSVMAGAVVKLATCVEVPGHGQRLLMQGSVACWSSEAWWQWMVAAWGLACTALVPASVVVGGWLLRRGAIRPGWFWLSLLLPLPCLVAWCVSGRVRAARKHHDTSSLADRAPGLRAAALMALGSGYRADAWWWDAVLLLRRLLLSALPLVLHQAPVLQAVVAQLLLICFLVAHVAMKPLVSRATNALETAFLCSLLAISGLSIRSGTLMSVSVQDPEREGLMFAGVTVLLYAAAGLGLLYYGLSAAGRAREWWAAKKRRATETTEMQVWTVRPGAV